MVKPSWWQVGVIYQVYPRSFQDSNHDGIGDLKGIISRLGYLADLGVDIIWISPIYPSPMVDFGYDVSNHTDVHPMFGTLADFDALIAEAHGLGLKVVLDFVPNHTSDQHAWFQEARVSKDSPKRDWYIWRDPARDGGPPNNWLSEFGGSAWEFDAATGQYYYHAFLKEQPDINWRNEEAAEAMLGVMRFWLKRGVDGFRIDALFHVMKDEGFRNNPVNPDYNLGMDPYFQLLPLYTVDTLEVQHVVSSMRKVADEYGSRLLIGEAYLPFNRLAAYFGRARDGVHLPFNFSLIGARWQAGDISALVSSYEASLPSWAWPNWVLSNHDRRRIVGRVGPDQARVAAMLLLTLRGTPTLYYGDEIGMKQALIPEDKIQDPFEKNVPGLGLGRDGSRTPMQWDDGPHAGFSDVEPWLPLADDYTEVNVKAEQGSATSMLTLTKALLALRRAHPALSVGAYHNLGAHGDLVVYERESGAERMLVVLNLGSEPAQLRLPRSAPSGQVLLSTFLDRAGEAISGPIDMRPNEGVVVELQPDEA